MLYRGNFDYFSDSDCQFVAVRCTVVAYAQLWFLTQSECDVVSVVFDMIFTLLYLLHANAL